MGWVGRRQVFPYGYWTVCSKGANSCKTGQDRRGERRQESGGETELITAGYEGK